VDSGVGFESDSCSGSYEAKDASKGSKFKEKLVSALSPESSRKHEGSPKKIKSSNSPITSPQIGSLVKRSKIEDDGDCDTTSLNLSPSIRFIDASSSYELGQGVLGQGVSSETIGDSRTDCTPQPEDNWSEGLDTVRKRLEDEDEVVEAQVHQQPDQTVDSFSTTSGPISIIKGTLTTNTTTGSVEDCESVVDQTMAHTPASIHSGTGTLLSEDSVLSQESSTRSDLSVSIAGATVSENESFGLESTNDDSLGNDDEKMISQTKEIQEEAFNHNLANRVTENDEINQPIDSSHVMRGSED